MSFYKYFTSESVSDGHPDKVADQVSDAIVDAIFAQDTEARIACETLVKTGLVLLAGEIRTNIWVDHEAIARETIKSIGYTDASLGFDADSCAVISAIGKQSIDIAKGVDASKKKSIGAGDQGMMFGFACKETPTLMPAPIHYAHALMLQQKKMRSKHNFLLPDAKSQITFRYNEKGKPEAIDAVVLSTQHSASIKNKDLKECVREEIINKVLPAKWLHKGTKYHINPTGRFVIGGPTGDCGLTGRKIIVDTYGGYARHGGGAFSGKDGTKVDRSAAYACRYVAKNIVAAGLADVCEIQISYAIGVAHPTSISVNTFGTSKVSEDRINKELPLIFDLTPEGIIDMLSLRQPIYQQTAAFGHFGRKQFSWEQTDKVEALKKALL